MDPILAKFQQDHFARAGGMPTNLRAFDMVKPDVQLSRVAAEYALFEGKLGNGHMLDRMGAKFLMNLGGAQAVHIDRALTTLAVFFRNREYVADLAMPIVRVPNKSDTYFSFDVSTMQLIANTQVVGNRGRPGEVATFSPSSSNTFSVSDHALMDFVSADEEANADPPLMPRMTVTEVLTNYLLLARERRVASVVTTAGNYGASTTALAGPTQWNNYATSDPVTDILIALETPFVRPNWGFMDPLTFITFRNHPNILRYVVGRAGTQLGATPALVDEEFLARAFSLDGFTQARAKFASNAEGLAFVSSYVWGKFFAALRVEDQPDRRRTNAFGYTFRFGAFETRAIPDFIAGRAGGTWIKISHADSEKTVGGGNSSYLIDTPIP